MAKPKQYKITNEQLEQMITVIVIFCFNEESAIKYASRAVERYNKDNENENT